MKKRAIGGISGRWRVVAVAAALIALAAIAGSALAATGGLRFAGCIEDEDRDREGEKCANTPALDYPSAVAVSADGRSLYAVVSSRVGGGGASGGHVVRFDRDPMTGGLAFAQCFEDEDTNLEGAKCADAPGLEGVRSVAVSPDGRSVYATASLGDAIVRFDRDPMTGALAFAQCFEDEDTNLEGANCADAPALLFPNSVAVSPDGRSVYAASGGDNAIVSFERDPTTGALGFARCIEDEDRDPQGPQCTNAPGLAGANSVAVSPDGRSLYASSEDHAIVRFDRNRETGALDFAGCFEEEQTNRERGKCANAPGLEFPNSVAVSPDGRSLYVASGVAIVRFDRKRKTGALRFANCFDDEDYEWTRKCRNTPGLEEPRSVAVSPDGRSLYVASYLTDDAIVRFQRKKKTGALRFAGCIEDEDRNKERRKCANAPGLQAANAVTVNADSKSVYAASIRDGAIAHFRSRSHPSVTRRLP